MKDITKRLSIDAGASWTARRFGGLDVSVRIPFPWTTVREIGLSNGSTGLHCLMNRKGTVFSLYLGLLVFRVGFSLVIWDDRLTLA